MVIINVPGLFCQGQNSPGAARGVTNPCFTRPIAYISHSSGEEPGVAVSKLYLMILFPLLSPVREPLDR